MNLPDQPVEMDKEETVRFVPNNIVRYLLDHKGEVTLNDLAKISYVFKQSEWDQFYQLIGYSTDSYQELSRVSPEASERAREYQEKCVQAQPAGEDS